MDAFEAYFIKRFEMSFLGSWTRMSTFLCGQRFHIVSGRPEFEGVFKDEILPEMKSRLLATGDAKALEAIRKLDDAMEQVDAMS